MTENWREWEGRTVDGKFVLGNCLGGSDGSAVFRTRVPSGGVGNASGGVDDAKEAADAAIKLVALSGAEAESQLRRWKAASELSHPNLIHILAKGHIAGEGKELVYVVEEFAEENLAQIVPERALTTEEVRGMLGPVLAALEYVHGTGMVHGAIKPSNIMAAGDQVKLSSDDLRKAGEVPRRVSPYDAPEAALGVSAASDAWSLGITLVEVLTQHVPGWDAARLTPPNVDEDVPEPIHGIAQCCLQIDPAKRCGLREIGERLEGKRAATVELTNSTAAAQQKSSKWPYLLALAAVVVVVVFLIARPRWLNGPAGGPGEGQTSSAPPPTVQNVPAQERRGQSSEGQPAAERKDATAQEDKRQEKKPNGSGTSGKWEAAGGEKAVAKDEIVERVMPQVSPSAQRTITGRIKVRVKVRVDAAGHVAQATLKEAGPSKYFARVALEAAKRWKFSPAQDGNREWTLLFVFSRGRTETAVSH